MNVWQQVEEMARTLPAGAAQVGRQVYLAGLGAVSVATNAGETLSDMLVEEGRRAYYRERKRVDALVKSAATEVEQATHVIEDGFNQASRVALGRLGMPTRRDVADLTTRVEQLTAKVDTLARRRRVAKKGGRHGR
jgi:poly(hydroxyalkanoate) granule-associated protein